MRIPYHIRLPVKDFFQGLFLGTLGLQHRLRKHLKDQKRSYPKAERYSQGYFYQGLEDIGITGGKPTGFRFSQYEVDSLLKDAEILDIGSNAGFVACYCAQKGAASVTAVEINPFLNRIANDTAKFLKLKNVEVIESDFSKFSTDRKFDIVLSLSNHHTIDGKFFLPFDQYVKKVANLLKPEGYLLFESHNVFGPGKGGIGDDGDMELKFQILNRIFDIERYRMVKCYLKHGTEDLDKLFIVAQKSGKPKAVHFTLSDAIGKYHW